MTDVILYDEQGEDNRLKSHESFASFLVPALQKASIVASVMTKEHGFWREQRRIFFLHPSFDGCRKVASATMAAEVGDL